MSRNLNRSIIMSVIPSANDSSLYLKITDYYEDPNHNYDEYINCIFKNQEHKLPLMDRPLNQKEFPQTIGRRYFKIQGYIFFLDQASDNAGAFQ